MKREAESLHTTPAELVDELAAEGEHMIPLHQDGRGLTDGELEGLRRFVDDKGLGQAAYDLGCSKESIARMLARLPCTRKTVAFVRERFEKVGIHVDK